MEQALTDTVSSHWCHRQVWPRVSILLQRRICASWLPLRTMLLTASMSNLTLMRLLTWSAVPLSWLYKLQCIMRNWQSKASLWRKLRVCIVSVVIVHLLRSHTGPCPLPLWSGCKQLSADCLACKHAAVVCRGP